jgi:hypothetical protein
MSILRALQTSAAKIIRRAIIGGCRNGYNPPLPGYIRRHTVKHPSLLLLFSSVVLVGSSLAQTGPPPIPPGPLGDIDTVFLNEYSARIDAITKEHPLYIEVSGNDLILHRNGREESKRVVPDIYHALKDVSHVPFLLYLRLSPLSSDEQLTATDIAGLEKLSTEISAARDALSTGGFNAVQMKRQQRIMERSLTFLHATIETRRISRSTLDGFTHAMAPLLLENVDEAACSAIHGMHAQMMQWKSSMTAEQWKRVIVINPGTFQPRYRSLATQYFGWLFPAPAPPWAYPGENQRVIYSEFLHPHRNSAELLATILIDADTAAAFFGNRWKLSEDLLGDSAAHCIAQLPKSDRIWSQ